MNERRGYDDGAREQLAVVSDRQNRREDGVWIRWAAGILIGAALTALAAVMSMRDRVGDLNTSVKVMEVKDQQAGDEREKIGKALATQSESLGQLKESIKALTDRMGELVEEEKRRDQQRGGGAKFPGGLGSTRFEK